MKRKVFTIISMLLCFTLLLSIKTYATSFSVSGTDLTIKIDDSKWYVFTRDNIKNNPELDECGVSYSTMYNLMHNNKIYIDAFLSYTNGDYIELFVRKTNIDKIVNLSNYNDDDVMSLAKELGSKNNTKNYSIYKTQYKFVKLEYSDSGFYICEYLTVVNGENYTLTFQATSPFTNAEYSEIESIVKSVLFNIDPSLKEDAETSWFDGLFDKFIGGVLVAAIASGISFLFLKKKKGKSTEVESSEPLNVDDSNEKL